MKLDLKPGSSWARITEKFSKITYTLYTFTWRQAIDFYIYYYVLITFVISLAIESKVGHGVIMRN